MPENNLFSIVNLVNCYNNEVEVIAYANMLSTHKCQDYLLLAVNVNSLSNEYDPLQFASELKNKYKSTLLVSQGTNQGYLNGMIFSYNEFEKRYQSDGVKWVIMSNTDIIVEQKCFFQKLITSVYSKDVACIGPSVYSKQNQSYCNPQYLKKHTYFKLSMLIFIMEHKCLAFLYFKLAKIKAHIKNNKIKKESCYMSEAHGCFFILTKDFMDKLKYYKYPCLMYSEESFISILVHNSGKKEYYDSNLEVIHLENTVTSLLGTKNKAIMIAKSLRCIRNLFYNNSRSKNNRIC